MSDADLKSLLFGAFSKCSATIAFVWHPAGARRFLFWGEIIFDPFCGSGTMLCAAELTGRCGVAVEIEPKYVAVSLQRLSDMGLKPKLVKS